MATFVSWFFGVRKWICYFLSQRWKSLLVISRPRPVCQNNGFRQLLFTIFAKALRTLLLVFVFRGSVHANCENTPMTINTNLWPLFNFFSFVMSIKLVCHWCRCRWRQCDDFGTGRCKVYVSWPDNHSLAGWPGNFYRLGTPPKLPGFSWS